MFCVDGTAQTKIQSLEHVVCLERQSAMWPGTWDGASHDAAGTAEWGTSRKLGMPLKPLSQGMA